MLSQPKIILIGYCQQDPEFLAHLSSNSLLELTVFAQQVQIAAESEPVARRLYTCLFSGELYNKARSYLKPNQRMRLQGQYVLFKKQLDRGWVNKPTVWVEQFTV